MEKNREVDRRESEKGTGDEKEKKRSGSVGQVTLYDKGQQRKVREKEGNVQQVSVLELVLTDLSGPGSVEGGERSVTGHLPPLNPSLPLFLHELPLLATSSHSCSEYPTGLRSQTLVFSQTWEGLPPGIEPL